MRVFSAIAALLGAATVAGGQPSPGLAVGKKAVDFTLEDQSGQSHSLEPLLGRGMLAIVFYRSADW